jgi:HSP20 family protein
MAVVGWRPFGEGLEPWVGAREPGDVQSAVDRLSLNGQRMELEAVKPERYFRAERWAGRVERTSQLPIPVQADKVRASYREGVLTVTLPRIEAVKSKEIKIDVM